jgi:membrane-bound metal-dependent hydrolase YbcI (DUF457 family)
MRLRTHFTLTAFFLSLLWSIYPNVLFTGIALISTIMPDLDLHFKSIIGHRGVMHSLTFAFILFILLIPLLSFTLALAFLLGYSLHLFGDVLTISGVPLFWPYEKRTGLKLFATGSFFETIVFYCLFAAFAMRVLLITVYV